MATFSFSLDVNTLFSHMVHMGIVNGFILFQAHHSQNPKLELLQRQKSYSLLDFREKVIRQLINIPEYSTPPMYKNFEKPIDSRFSTDHLPEFTEEKRYCKLCFKKIKQQSRVHTKCSTPQCDVYLHFTKDKNCFRDWHSTFEHKK